VVSDARGETMETWGWVVLGVCLGPWVLLAIVVFVLLGLVWLDDRRAARERNDWTQREWWDK
jgi:hypothetical protein